MTESTLVVVWGWSGGGMGSKKAWSDENVCFLNCGDGFMASTYVKTDQIIHFM